MIYLKQFKLASDNAETNAIISSLNSAADSAAVVDVIDVYRGANYTGTSSTIKNPSRAFAILGTK